MKVVVSTLEATQYMIKFDDIRNYADINMSLADDSSTVTFGDDNSHPRLITGGGREASKSTKKCPLRTENIIQPTKI